MEDHARILQQRIEVIAVGWSRQQSAERIRGQQGEGKEADRDHAHHGQDAGAKFLAQRAGKADHCRHPSTQHQRPEQQRALVPAPDAAETVVPGQQQVGVRRDILDREIVLQETPGQRGEGSSGKYKHTERQRAGAGHQAIVASPGPDQRQDRQQQRQDQRQDQGELAELGNHPSSP